MRDRHIRWPDLVRVPLKQSLWIRSRWWKCRYKRIEQSKTLHHVCAYLNVFIFFDFDFVVFIEFIFFWKWNRSTQAPTTWSVAREIVRKDGLGLRGLNKGLTATIGRNGAFNMIYFGFYHSVREHFPAYEVHMVFQIRFFRHFSLVEAGHFLCAAIIILPFQFRLFARMLCFRLLSISKSMRVHRTQRQRRRRMKLCFFFYY